MTFGIYRQPYGADGSVDAKSAENAIGRSSLELWELLLRETLQNSWDARTGPTISYTIKDCLLNEQQTSVLQREIFRELPPSGRCVELHRHIQGGRLRALIISDEGTRGLGGPTRADVAPAPGEKLDFVDFVRNLGRSESKGYAGGTYGYGKGVLYRASKLGISLTYSQTLTSGGVEARIIGISGGDADYAHDGLRYTGRNWWGIPGADGIVDPATGSQARLLAERVGIPVPAQQSTGTSIMIIAPEDEGITNDSTRIRVLSEAAMKWAWPLAVRLNGSTPVDFSFLEPSGIEYKIDPLVDPTYNHFAQAYASLQQTVADPEHRPDWQTKFQQIKSMRPALNLGLLAYRLDVNPPAEASGLENTVALMRNPRLVVRYLPITPHPSGQPLNGVFVADPALDELFAKSEPAAHDDWIYKRAATRPNEANPVKIALDRVLETFKKAAVESARVTGSRADKGLSRLSANLGGLLSGLSGSGAEAQASGPGGGGSARQGKRSRKASVQPAGGPRLTEVGERVACEFDFAVRGGIEGSYVELRCFAQVVTESGITETESPIAADQPEFLGWKTTGEMDPSKSVRVRLPAEEVFTAVFRQPPDTAMKAMAQLTEVTSAAD